MLTIRLCSIKAFMPYSSLALGAWLMLATGCEGTKNELVKPDPPTVTVAHPLKQPLRTFLEQSGVTEAAQTAEVRARVRGFIEEVAFEPGATVSGTVLGEDGSESGGSVLYQIERDEYEAAYNAAVSAHAAAIAGIGVAESQVRVAEATLEQAKAERDRQTELKQRGVSSKTEFDAAVAAFKSAEANLSATSASVELAKAQAMQAKSAMNQAELDLNYTTVRAPIDGQVSTTLVKRGNLVEPVIRWLCLPIVGRFLSTLA
jgi:multidrug resistance efflux pump